MNSKREQLQADIDEVMGQRFDETTAGVIDYTRPEDPARAGQLHGASVRLLPETFIALGQAADRLGVRPTVLMRRLIEDGLQRLNTPESDLVMVRRTALLEALDEAVDRAAA